MIEFNIGEDSFEVDEGSIPDMYLRSLTDETMGEECKRMMGVIVVRAMETMGAGELMINIAKDTYREKYIGMFPTAPCNSGESD